MQKSFYNHYNKWHEPKYFFQSKLEVRSTAYGSGVAQSFCAWLKYFYDNWNSNDNFLLSKQASVDGNAVRGSIRYRPLQKLGVLPACGKGSFLPPLYLRNRLFEVSESGIVLINGEQQADIGRELKAWALQVLKEGDTECVSLAVIAKPKPNGSKMCLSLYAVDGDEVSAEAYATYPLGATLRSFSEIMCFGRHIFIRHDGQLLYLYLSPISGKLEEVPIGDWRSNRDKPCCSHVGEGFVTDGKHVFWVADNTIYGIPIGAPHRLLRFAADKGVTFKRLSCFDGALYAMCLFGGRSRCYCYKQGGSGYERTIFCEDGEDIVFLNNESSRLRYVRIARGTIEDVVRAREDGVAARLELKGTSLFCFGTSVAEDVRYIGYGKHGELVSFKIE